MLDRNLLRIRSKPSLFFSDETKLIKIVSGVFDSNGPYISLSRLTLFLPEYSDCSELIKLNTK